MPSSFVLRVQENKIGPLADLLERAADRAVRKAAFDLEARMKANVGAVGAVDTGSLRSSIWTATSQGDGYAAAISTAQGANPEAAGVGGVGRAKEGQAYVGVGVQHGIYVEFGTYRMPARPYFTPAVEWLRPLWPGMLKQAITQALS